MKQTYKYSPSNLKVKDFSFKLAPYEHMLKWLFKA